MGFFSKPQFSIFQEESDLLRFLIDLNIECILDEASPFPRQHQLKAMLSRKEVFRKERLFSFPFAVENAGSFAGGGKRYKAIFFPEGFLQEDFTGYFWGRCFLRSDPFELVHDSFANVFPSTWTVIPS